MADDVTDNPVKIHQKLHGYAQGHQELASSVRLSARDERALQVLSDASGPGLRPSEQGYITGYPLSESKYYALARTWPAPEVSRPGCVWTHTLLIDFADLASLANPRELLSLFSRPREGNFQQYTGEIGFSPMGFTKTVVLDAAFLARVVRALYLKPQGTAQVSAPDNIDADDCVAEIWAQQWPRLRRSFRFCTLAAGNRQAMGAPFDLQVSPSGRPARPTDAIVSATDQTDTTWMEEAVEDLLTPNIHGLRSFLRQVGAEIDFGREAFPLLCAAHAISRNQSGDAHFSHILEAFTSAFGRDQAHALRRSLLNLALRNSRDLRDSDITFVLENLSLADDDAILEDRGFLGQRIWESDQQQFISMLRGEDVASRLVRSALREMDAQEVTRIVNLAPDTLEALIAVRKDFLEDPEFWSKPPNTNAIGAALATLTDMPAYQGAAVEAIVASRRTDVARRAAPLFEPSTILDSLSRVTRDGALAYTLDPWLEHITQNHPDKIARFLADNSRSSPVALLESIARKLTPDAIPNYHRPDPWYTATNAASPAEISQYLLAFLLSRSLGKNSSNAAELAQIAYEQIYVAATRSAVSYDAWRILEPRLPMPYLWPFWDRCEALRSAVATLFAEQKLSPLCFANIAKSDEVFEVTARAAARLSSGKHFLREVKHALESSAAHLPARAELLNTLID